MRCVPPASPYWIQSFMDLVNLSTTSLVGLREPHLFVLSRRCLPRRDILQLVMPVGNSGAIKAVSIHQPLHGHFYTLVSYFYLKRQNDAADSPLFRQWILANCAQHCVDADIGRTCCLG